MPLVCYVSGICSQVSCKCCHCTPQGADEALGKQRGRQPTAGFRAALLKFDVGDEDGVACLPTRTDVLDGNRELPVELGFV